MSAIHLNFNKATTKESDLWAKLFIDDYNSLLDLVDETKTILPGIARPMSSMDVKFIVTPTYVPAVLEWDLKTNKATLYIIRICLCAMLYVTRLSNPEKKNCFMCRTTDENIWCLIPNDNLMAKPTVDLKLID